MANTLRFFLIGLACLALTACGGGGGGGGGSDTNQAPTASFTATPGAGESPHVVSFDASASSDPDSSIASYRWSFGDDATGSGVSVSHTYARPGTYIVTLTVADSAGASSIATRTISVANRPPVAAFTISQVAGDAPLAIDVDASGSSDPDGSIASYRWDFDDCSSASGRSASRRFTLPGAYRVTLTVRDDQGAESTATRIVDVSSAAAAPGVTVSGRILFERVPFATALGAGLDYTRTFEAPARHVVVELVRDSDRAVIGAVLTDQQGNYSVVAPVNTVVFVRARVATRTPSTFASPASWSACVKDNTAADAPYVLDGSVFNTGSTDQTRNLKAATGWSGGSAGTYTGVRAAAPFAVLDTIYSAVQFVITQGDGSAQLPALNAFWSERNVPVAGDLSLGQIDTTAYYPVNSGGIAPGIYVLGAASNDTDEFDQHIIAHEFQHYLEDALSRADTVGGEHALNERLDMRVAFSEGYSNAFSAMVLSDPLYRDSFGTAQGTDFHFSVESTATLVPGWYNESSVHRIVWDLFDTANDGADALSIGYGPMHDVFKTELRDDVPLTSLFAFITALKQRPGVPAGQVDVLVEAERSGTNLGIVSTTMTPYADTETHSGVADTSSDLVLPVHTQIALGGSMRVCTSSSVTSTTGTVIPGSYNKIGNRRFLRFSVPTARTINITLSCPSSDADCGGAIVPDPDFVVSRGRSVTSAESSTPRVEQLDYPAAAGDHVLEVFEWSQIDPDATDTQRRGRTCMTVNITG